MRLKLVLVATSLLLNACTTGLHGNFIEKSHIPPQATGEELGLVSGKSCQLAPLYIFAWGDPATTKDAIQDALQQRQGTLYLANIGIDDRVEWGVLFARECIYVDALAYR